MKRPMLRQCLVAILAASSLGAHHSTAPFDMTQGFTISGQVAEFRWTNPHSYVFLDVADESQSGEPQRWTVELESLNLLRRNGWTKETLQPGDAFTCMGARAKQPDVYALKCFTVTLEDGTTLPGTPMGIGKQR